MKQHLIDLIGVSQRLGPPQTKSFATTTTAKPQVVLGEAEERGGIFERLGVSPEPLVNCLLSVTHEHCTLCPRYPDPRYRTTGSPDNEFCTIIPC